MCVHSNKIAKWDRINNELKVLRAKEMTLRMEIAADILGATVEGTVNQQCGKYELKAVGKVRRILSEKAFLGIQEALSTEELNAVKMKPSLKTKEFRDLPKDSLLISECVTTKPASPTLTIVSIEE